ncbi:NAD(P)-binding protein [Cupriavidus basilensis]
MLQRDLPESGIGSMVAVRLRAMPLPHIAQTSRKQHDGDNPLNASAAPGNQIVIIGAGVAGMCTGIRLRQAGIDTFVVFGNAGTVGGSWRDSTGPGRGCDIPPACTASPSHQSLDWSSAYLPQSEIPERFGPLGHVRYGTDRAAPGLNGTIKRAF